MSRLQKKCLLASAATHSLLLALLLLAPAFMDFEDKVETIPVITLIPRRLIDEKLAGGGSPNASPPAARQVQLPPASPPEPRPPTPPPPKSQAAQPEPIVQRRTSPVEPEPAPVRTVKNPKAEPTPIKPKQPAKEEASSKADQAKSSSKEKPRRTAPQIQPTFDKPSAAERARVEAKARAEAEAQERDLLAQYAARVREVGDSLSQNLSGGTTIEPLGPGGEAYAYYGSAIVKIFDVAWITPADVTESDATVKATVTIRRDGTVLSRRISRRSGIPAVDASVQRALDRVITVPPFPDGAKEEQRSFILNFNLKAKRLSG